MRIVLLTQWYPPEPAKIAHDMARGFLAAGHEVTVLTGFPNYPSGKIYPGYRLGCWRKEKSEGLSVVRVPLYPSHDNSSGKRIANYVSFAASAALLGAAFIPRPDIIHVYHPPLTTAGAGWLLSRIWQVPFTLDVYDMWPESIAASGMVRNERILRNIGRMANFSYRRAAAIRVVSPGFLRNLLDKGVPEQKLHLISNWVDNELYRPQEPDPAFAEKFGLSNRFNVIFAGNIGFAQGLDAIIDAAEDLRDTAEMQFVFIGDGADRLRIEEMVRQRGMSNVVFLGWHPPEDMPRFFALADVLIVNLRDDPLFRITIPHKILSYLASGKPLLAAVTGDAADVVTQAGAGVVCHPSDSKALAQSLRQLYAMPTEERQRMAENGRKAAVEQYGQDILMGKLIEMLEETVHQRQGRRSH